MNYNEIVQVAIDLCKKRDELRKEINYLIYDIIVKKDFEVYNKILQSNGYLLEKLNITNFMLYNEIQYDLSEKNHIILRDKNGNRMNFDLGLIYEGDIVFKNLAKMDVELYNRKRQTSEIIYDIYINGSENLKGQIEKCFFVKDVVFSHELFLKNDYNLEFNHFDNSLYMSNDYNDVKDIYIATDSNSVRSKLSSEFEDLIEAKRTKELELLSFVIRNNQDLKKKLNRQYPNINKDDITTISFLSSKGFKIKELNGKHIHILNNKSENEEDYIDYRFKTAEEKIKAYENMKKEDVKIKNKRINKLI